MYLPTLSAGALFSATEAVLEFEVLYSPASTVAVMVRPPVPVVSTMMVDVPWLELIVLAGTVQL